ncbi:MAG: HlyD family efflux transporter periplasmic adaptor subunit [Planctomycetes bacterium]|nr:HlyD family efflux transporter periplasmic adaptor subunit [Planctomycetota bacterium]
MSAIRLLIAVGLLLPVSGVDRRYADENGNPMLDRCLIKLKGEDEIRIPAQVSGVLISMPVKEGSWVAKGDLLATIDDREAKAALQVAQYGLQSAQQRAQEDIEIRYAQAAEAVAKIDVLQDLKANRDFAGSIPEIEIRRKKLDLTRSTLQIEKAQKDQILAGLEAKTKGAERDAAQMALERRTILAPFDGEVVTTYRHQSEWVNPGDPILKLVRFDTLHVEGFVYSDQYDRGELQGKRVTVNVVRARGRAISVEGSIVYVDQMVRSDGSYPVRAEVKNEREGDNWLIQPGLKARMTIHLNE